MLKAEGENDWLVYDMILIAQNCSRKAKLQCTIWEKKGKKKCTQYDQKQSNKYNNRQQRNKAHLGSRQAQREIESKMSSYGSLLLIDST